MVFKCIHFLIFILLFDELSALKEQDLGGVWFLTNIQKGYNLKAFVPGGVYTDLMQNDIIKDVFYGYNDVRTRWVSKSNWNYTKTFTVNTELATQQKILLVFDGIDTFSKIYVNNILVGSTANMFIKYEFNLKTYVIVGTNILRVEFQSPVVVARNLFKKQLENYLVPPICVPSEYNGECHVNHIRKMQASFGWDWGPAFPSMGIWKKVYLQGYNSAALSEITTFLSSDDVKNSWNILFNVYFKTSCDNILQGDLKITIQTEILKITEIYKVNIQKDMNGEFIFSHNLTIPKSYVNLWWPNGYGKPFLYELRAMFVSPDKTEQSEKLLKIGFRKVDLVQNVLEKGKSFYLKINDIPIFVKGSNIIPLSILPELSYNSTHIKFLLQSSKDVHMNMLRVWGGGLYESDAFYKTADELGLLIWQDFMFACSMYPVTEEFLKNVSLEVKQQVRRLQYHPSIVVWAASNENEVALRQNWYGTNTNFSLYKNDFKILYVNTIKSQVLSIDKTRPFLTSSPTNGIQSEMEDYVAKDPQSHFYGDVHFYNYFMDGWNQNIYPINRFASEYGYQSLPSVRTLLTATNNTHDLNIFDNFLKHRQHHEFGYLQMDLLINFQLKLPSESSQAFYKAFIFYSQIVQAMSIKIETELYRRWRSNINDIGEGLTMGTLYWQLNDVWAAPSWSSIDFKNNWKMLHYYAKNFFAPIIITTEMSASKDMNVYIVSDLLKTFHNSLLNIGVYKWNSVAPVYETTIKIDVLPGLAKKVQTYSLRTFFSEIKDKPCEANVLENCFVYFTLTDRNKNKIAPDNYLFPVALKHSRLVAPNLQMVNVSQVDSFGRLFEITIKTDVVTLFVWLDIKDINGRFSENGFLQVTEEKIIQFISTVAISLEKLLQNLSVTHLLNKEYC
ncbi:hypothetical protein RN001_002274 [Aquatica leii]|uniref:beta-mannosidase n=1 Tax=Aquatica leii TaxID=1421715 RepID=A0AAN7SR65_9COLE|nr:hypothetical protein RN001_002274 [Aquatica leii]